MTAKNSIDWLELRVALAEAFAAAATNGASRSDLATIKKAMDICGDQARREESTRRTKQSRNNDWNEARW